MSVLKFTCWILQLLGIAWTNYIYRKCILLSKLSSSFSKHHFLKHHFHQELHQKVCSFFTIFSNETTSLSISICLLYRRSKWCRWRVMQIRHISSQQKLYEIKVRMKLGIFTKNVFFEIHGMIFCCIFLFLFCFVFVLFFFQLKLLKLIKRDPSLMWQESILWIFLSQNQAHHDFFETFCFEFLEERFWIIWS